MQRMKNLLDALAECGEMAAFYKGQKIVMVNGLLADLFGREIDEFEGLPIVEILNEESIDLIRDFIRRREHGDSGVPITYKAAFRTPDNPKTYLTLTVLKTSNTGGALLVILQKNGQ
ncbi:MAG: PAS domain-containing protein [bacterium]|nr:MAG: PAS domain-containing protein [bacterium]